MLIDVVNKAKLKWEYTYNWRMPLKPKFPVICHFCNTEMVFHWYRPHERPYKNPKAHKYRIDIGFKCMNCFHVEVFGVPVEYEYWKFIREEIFKHTGSYDTIVNAADVYEYE